MVTNVGRDHTDGGPGWRVAIATEKAGIIEPESHLVLGETDPDIQAVFTAEGPAATWTRDVDFGCEANRVAVGGRLVDLWTPSEPGRGPLPAGPRRAPGRQRRARPGRRSRRSSAPPPRRRSSPRRSPASSSPGGFEVVRREPTVVIDSAHNVDGARAAAQTLAEDFTLAGSVVMVVGLLQGRDPAEMLEALGATEAGFVVTCTPPSPRAIPAPEVAAAAERLGIAAEAVSDVADGGAPGAGDRHRRRPRARDRLAVRGGRGTP